MRKCLARSLVSVFDIESYKMKQACFVICCISVAVHGASVKPVARSLRSDEDYSSGPSGSGLYPEQTGARYPAAIEEEPTSADHESHPYAQSQVSKTSLMFF